MKLYSKHDRLLNNSCELNNNDVFVRVRFNEVYKKCGWGYDSKSYRLRNQFWLDIKSLGKNYFNQPFILKPKK